MKNWLMFEDTEEPHSVVETNFSLSILVQKEQSGGRLGGSVG